ncbi:YycH family protein [Weissella oryzae SG25]|uniref:YycH family protein n=1 Tax=Weissella oryzae (strain DSM 25784 / JCM 18191 / LMG 30913 / SG25) TaxID=1329250 RepID=A0A069CUN0_WEIOS|nr:two-component system activity regulator YycH [Weissella oryzae]GAK30928.1 YycH family protein [Weissella oryzae SG25]
MIRDFWVRSWRIVRQLGLYLLLSLAILMSLIFSLALWQSPQRVLDAKPTNSKQQTLTNRSTGDIYDFSALVLNQKNGMESVGDFRPLTDEIVKQVNDHKVKALHKQNLAESDYLNNLQREGTVVLAFPDQVAGGIVNDILGKQYRLPNNVGINYVQLDHKQDQITFYSTEQHAIYPYKVLEKSVALPTIEKQTHLTPVKWTKLAGKINLSYEQAVPMQRYRYLISNANMQAYASSLFSDSKQVDSSQDASGDTVYADGENKRLVINPTAKMATFDVFNGQKATPSLTKMMTTGYNTLNEIQQTGDNMNYFASEDDGKTLLYRLNVDGLPIFNSDNLGTVKVQMVNSGHLEVAFSGTTLQVPLPVNDDDVVTIPSTAGALEWAGQIGVDTTKIEGLQIGYYWQTTDTDTVILQPEWFYKYAGSWQILGTNPANRTGGK